MNKYEIDLHLYPLSVVVEASTEDEAKEKAKKIFDDKYDGKSLYECEITNIIPLA